MNTNYGIGVAQWCLDVDGTESLARAAEFGLSAMHLTGGPELFSSPDLQREYVGASHRTGVRMSMFSLNCLLQSGGLGDEGARREHARIFESAILAAVAMEIGIVYLPGFVDLEIKSESDLFNTAALFQGACRFAADKPVLIATENSLGVEENERLFERVDEPNFRLFFDTQNPLLWGHRPVDIVHRFADRMCDQVHIKDGIGGKMGNASLFKGQGLVKETLDALISVGFSGDLVLENDYHADTEVRLRQDVDELKRVLSKN